MNRIKELDGLRGIAVIMVLIWHYITCQYIVTVESSQVVALLFLLTKVFWSGVDLFFVLSGFLIGGIILSQHEKSNFLSIFWIRRACRILPPFVLLSFLYIVFVSTPYSSDLPWLFDRAMPTLSYLTMTQNIFMGLKGTFGANFMAVTWSLAVEEQFYVFAPLLVMLLGSKAWVRLLVPLALTSLMLRVAFPGFHSYVNTIFRLDALLFGFLVAAIYSNEMVWAKMLARKYFILSALVIKLFIVAGVAYKFSIFHELKFYWFAVFYTSVLLTVLVFQGSSMTLPLRSKILGFWGMLAYGIYLYHQAIAGFIHGYFRNGAAPQIVSVETAFLTLLSLIITTVVAMISYHYFESHFIRYGKSKKYI